MAVSYVVGGIGMTLELVMDASDIIGSDDTKNQIAQALSDHPQLASRVILVITGLIVVARLRSLLGWGKKQEEDPK